MGVKVYEYLVVPHSEVLSGLPRHGNNMDGPVFLLSTLQHNSSFVHLPCKQKGMWICTVWAFMLKTSTECC